MTARFLFSLPFPLSPLPFCPKGLKGSPRSFHRLLNDRVCVGDADKAGFKLRRREVNLFIEHCMKKLTVQFPIALVGCRPIRDWPSGEEAGPHGADSVSSCLNPGVSRGL